MFLTSRYHRKARHQFLRTGMPQASFLSKFSNQPSGLYGLVRIREHLCGSRPVILKSIIALAHDLGMDVVAEGAEDGFGCGRALSARLRIRARFCVRRADGRRRRDAAAHGRAAGSGELVVAARALKSVSSGDTMLLRDVSIRDTHGPCDQELQERSDPYSLRRRSNKGLSGRSAPGRPPQTSVPERGDFLASPSFPSRQSAGSLEG